MFKLRLWVFILVGVIVAFGACYIYVYLDLSPAKQLPEYQIRAQHDDTLRVVMIGDSWAMLHNKLNRDSVLQSLLQFKLDIPIRVRSRGVGGANSKEIYYYMFASKTTESEYEPDKCTQPLLEESPHYCLISAGINDAGQGKGADFFCKNYMKILRLLLHNNIKPVVLELPTVILDNKVDMVFEDFFNENRFFAWYRLKKRMGFKVTAMLNDADMDHVDECRERLRQMLDETGLIDSVIFIPTEDWNKDGYKDSRGIYLDDGTHLNQTGYDVLDSCYAAVISKDYLRSVK